MSKNKRNRKESEWEKKLSDAFQELSPVPAASPQEEPQVDEVVSEEEDE